MLMKSLEPFCNITYISIFWGEALTWILEATDKICFKKSVTCEHRWGLSHDITKAEECNNLRLNKFPALEERAKERKRKYTSHHFRREII